MAVLTRAKRQGRKFENPVPTRLGGLKMMLELLPEYIRNKAETEPKVAPGPFRTDTSVYGRPPESGLRVTWFGHSSSLVELDGVRLLLDPVWDRRAGLELGVLGVKAGFGPKRFFAPTLGLDELPGLDAVVLSHDHYDHLGAETVRWFGRERPEVRWVTSLEVGRELVKLGVRREAITELDWTEKTTVQGADGAAVEITALPARHFSGRSLGNRFETLWSSFVLRGSAHKVYYGADSGFWEGFAEIGAEYGPFDLTMLEIGAFDVRWREIHLGPDGAAEAFHAMGAQGLLMPVHWGLFNLALHGWRQPMERLEEVAEARGMRLWSPEPGVPAEVREGEEVRAGWWRAAGAGAVPR